MAKGSAVTDELINILLIAGLIYGAKWMVDSGSLEQTFVKLREAGKNLKLPDLSGLLGGGGSGGIYKRTGRVMNAKDGGQGTRHYASGKPNDVTHEWNVIGCPFDAYEFDADVTVSKIDHDDQVSMKLYGPHHADGLRAWYVADITFKGGNFQGGYEDPHPNGDYSCIKGGSIGSIVGKTVHLKSVIWPLSGGGAHLEYYANGKKLFSGDNPCGKKYKRHPQQQVQLRIDAAPGVRASNVRVSEISV